jgi:hypothetical protein
MGIKTTKKILKAGKKRQAPCLQLVFLVTVDKTVSWNQGLQWAHCPYPRQMTEYGTNGE